MSTTRQAIEALEQMPPLPAYDSASNKLLYSNKEAHKPIEFVCQKYPDFIAELISLEKFLTSINSKGI